MSGHECSFCHVERAIIAVTPVVKGYAMEALECPKCKSVVRLVVMHRFPRHDVPEYGAETQTPGLVSTRV
jgi:hypothetical protein